MTKIKQFVTLIMILSMVTVCATVGFAANADNTADAKQEIASAKTDKKAGKVDDRVNINTANSEQLQVLPRIGPKMAQRIIKFREENGKFKKIEEIMKVKGIGEKTFKGFEKMIKI